MKWLLLPFSYLYAVGVWLRNKLFDTGIRKSAEFEIPIIVMGNLRVGGTGKTPHTEWLIEQLRDKYKVGMLSRGYGRRTKGFRWVETNDTAANCGDEPLQVKRKFPDVVVAVCEERTAAVPEMLAEHELDVIILDDAFQHRYIKPSFTIVLSAIDKPFFKDEYLPAGRLREKGSALKRADVFVYTKVQAPPKSSPEMGRTLPLASGEHTGMSHHPQTDIRRQQKVLPSGEDLGGAVKQAKKYNPAIEIYFSGYKYGVLKDLRTGIEAAINSKDVVVITGIADSSAFINHISSSYNIIKHFKSSDHFNYNAYDVKQWRKVASPLTPGGEQSRSIPIITTEKDAMRIKPLLDELEGISVYYIPIEVEILDGRAGELIKKVEEVITLSTVTDTEQ